MYVYVCVCVWVRMHHPYSIDTYVCMYMYACLYTRLCTYAYVCMYVCMYCLVVLDTILSGSAEMVDLVAVSFEWMVSGLRSQVFNV